MGTIYMIIKDNIITCESYKKLCDYVYKIGDEPKPGVVHVNMEEIPNFFSAIKDRQDKYIVVSSCSDFGLAYQEQHPVWLDTPKWVKMMANPSMGYNMTHIAPRCDLERCKVEDKYSVKCYSWTAYTFPSIPKNIVRWYMTNSRIYEMNEPRIRIIPFGIAANKQEDIMDLVENYLPTNSRKKQIYINWVNYTYERLETKELYRQENNSNVVIVDDAKPYKEYLKDLADSCLVLSPEGNGVDCYRTLEAIYMGAIPLGVMNATNEALIKGLPLAVSRDLSRRLVTSADHIDYIWNSVVKTNSIYSSLSYWKGQLEKDRRGLL